MWNFVKEYYILIIGGSVGFALIIAIVIYGESQPSLYEQSQAALRFQAAHPTPISTDANGNVTYRTADTLGGRYIYYTVTKENIQTNWAEFHGGGKSSSYYTHHTNTTIKGE